MNQLERFEKDIFQVILDFDKTYMSECCSTPIDINTNFCNSCGNPTNILIKDFN